MFSKLYSRITESSLMEEPINVRYTFVLMLAIADPEGYVIGTDVAIARRLNMPIGEFLECIAVLMAPDANSNSSALEGRRVVVSDGERGYHLVNFVNYRDMKSPQERRAYMRNYMREWRAKQKNATEPTEAKDVAESVNNGKPSLAGLIHADADADADVFKKDISHCENGKTKATGPRETFQSGFSESFEAFWKAYPRREGKELAWEAFQAVVTVLIQRNGWTDERAERHLIAAAQEYAYSPIGQPPTSGSDFRLKPAKWLSGGHYDDDRVAWSQQNTTNGQPKRDRKPKIPPPGAPKYQ